jgi:hypothetical protein
MKGMTPHGITWLERVNGLFNVVLTQQFGIGVMLHIREFTTLNSGLDTGYGQIYLFPRGKSQQISLSRS